MPSYYTVVQYVPDPVIDERINIGVIVAGEGKIRARFIKKWGRVRQFSGHRDITFLQDFARRVADASIGQLMLPHPDLAERDLLTEATLKTMIEEWGRSIQLSPPRGSLESHDDLLDEVAQRFLRESVRPPRRFRGRDDAAAITIATVKDALEAAVGDVALHVLKRRHTTYGRVYHHTIDAVVRNGRVYYAAHSLSYENPDPSSIEKDVQSTLWAVRDLKDSLADLPIGIMLLPPLEHSSRYDVDVKAMQDVGAAVLEEQEILPWAIQQSKDLPPGWEATRLMRDD